MQPEMTESPLPAATSAERPGTKPEQMGRSISLRRLRRGDQREFDRLYRRHHQEIYRYCLAILRSPEDAEDALQATMAAALRSLPGEERDIDLRPWLFRVAHNESISAMRRRRTDAELIEAEDPIAGSAEVEAGRRERLRQLVADLRELPERQRSALVMRELSGLSYAEIGAALGSAEGAARQRVHEARTALSDLAEGREMECEEIRTLISARDGRRLRGRRVRAHLRGCDGCTAFAAGIEQRRSDLQALCPPMPALAATAVLSGVLGGGGAAGAGAGAAGAGAGGLAGGGIAASAMVKGASIVAAGAIAVGAADVGGVIDVPGLGFLNDGREQPAAGNGSDAGSPDTGIGASGDSGDAPGHGGGAPGNSGDAPGHQGQGLPGRSGDAPGHDGSPGRSGDAPGHDGSPGNSGTAPGHDGSPGKSGSAPGHDGSPGNSGDAPGQSGSRGNSGSAPGQSGTAGNSGSAPGHTGSTGGGGSGSSGNGSGGGSQSTPPGQGTTPPGQGSPPPGQAEGPGKGPKP